MSEHSKQKLIILTGSPCVGKTTVTKKLFQSYHNSAYLDDDWVWMVNPFIMDDPRNKGIYGNMSFVLSTYLNLGFQYVFLSSVRMIGTGRESLLKKITTDDYITIGFHLTCSEETLVARHKKRGDAHDVSFEWLHWEPHHGDFVIDTDNKTVTQIVKEIKNIIDKFTKE